MLISSKVSTQSDAKPGQMTNKFLTPSLGKLCNVSSVLKQISRYATGSTRFTISVSSFSKIVIQLPSLEEQKKIANFLSSLDNKIELVSTQIENTKAFKKGLLQQMFV